MIEITSIASKLGIHNNGLGFVIVADHRSKMVACTYKQQGAYVC